MIEVENFSWKGDMTFGHCKEERISAVFKEISRKLIETSQYQNEW